MLGEGGQRDGHKLLHSFKHNPFTCGESSNPASEAQGHVTQALEPGNSSSGVRLKGMDAGPAKNTQP
eukprot:scaffold31414_cov15-Tisochrysis_lutea.AAC.1